MDQELYVRIQALRQLSLFRAKNESGDDRIVNAPYLGGPIASAFERLARFEDPTIELGRMGNHEIHHVCWGIDMVDDDVARIADVPAWTREGMVTVRHMAGGRC